MIAIATEDDIDSAIGMANGFAGKTVDEVSFISWWKRAIRSGTATVFKRESGGLIREAIGILMFSSPMHGNGCAAVSFWYHDPDDTSLVKGLLFARVFEFLKSQNYTRIYVSANLDNRFEMVSAFLKGYGFVPNEMQFVKEIGNHNG